jgi:hypothetical protein
MRALLVLSVHAPRLTLLFRRLTPVARQARMARSADWVAARVAVCALPDTTAALGRPAPRRPCAPLAATARLVRGPTRRAWLAGGARPLPWSRQTARVRPLLAGMRVWAPGRPTALLPPAACFRAQCVAARPCIAPRALWTPCPCPPASTPRAGRMQRSSRCRIHASRVTFVWQVFARSVLPGSLVGPPKCGHHGVPATAQRAIFAPRAPRRPRVPRGCALRRVATPFALLALPVCGT